MNINTQNGIIDHDKKFSLLQTVLGASNRRTAIDAMVELLPQPKQLPSGTKIDRNRIHSIIESSRKYNNSNPTRSVGPLYVELVVHTLQVKGWQHDDLKQLFMFGTYDDFFLHSPQGNSPHSRMPISPKASNRISIGYSRPPTMPTIEQMVHNGCIDQLIVWQPEDAPENWRKVVLHPNYPQYRHCTDTLSQFVETEYWRKYLNDHSPDRIVSLGCGSASKDVMMTENLAKHVNKTVYLTLVDYSTAMLYDTAREVIKEIEALGLSEKIHVHQESADFLHLEMNAVRRQGAPVVFMIAGGTIGNIDEGRLFASIANCSEPGDLFLVGAECLPEKESSDEEQGGFDETLYKKYNQSYANQLLSPALRAAWPFIRCKGKDFQTAVQNCIKPRLVRGQAHSYSRIINSVSVVFEVEDAEPNIVLLASTRYDEEELIKFAKHHDFELVEKTRSRENPLYRTFAFLYNPTTMTGYGDSASP